MSLGDCFCGRQRADETLWLSLGVSCLSCFFLGKLAHFATKIPLHIQRTNVFCFIGGREISVEFITRCAAPDKRRRCSRPNQVAITHPRFHKNPFNSTAARNGHWSGRLNIHKFWCFFSKTSLDVFTEKNFHFVYYTCRDIYYLWLPASAIVRQEGCCCCVGFFFFSSILPPLSGRAFQGCSRWGI